MSSLQPGLFPAPADLYQALRFAAVVVLTCGVGFLGGARRAETALFTGWGIACLVFVAVGCLTTVGLAPAALLLAVLGAVGLVKRFWFRAEAQDVMAWRVLALGAPTLLILLSVRTTAYDDFSFLGAESDRPLPERAFPHCRTAARRFLHAGLSARRRTFRLCDLSARP